MELEQVVDTVEVPRNTGVEGFLQLLRSILKLGRVQDIHITGNGRVTYKYLAPAGQPHDAFNPEQMFEQVSPAYVVRNSILQELRLEEACNSAEVLFRMMRAARLDGGAPLAWVTGADSRLNTWLLHRSDLPEDAVMPTDTMCGLPVYRDRMLPDESLMLCAGPRRGGDLVDTTHAYKIAMVLP
jgi:hypothetical protein